MAHLIALSVFVAAVTLLARRVAQIVIETPDNDGTKKESSNNRDYTK